MSCNVIIKKGKRCIPNKNATNECKTFCKLDLDYYHSLCDDYWNVSIENIKNMTFTELEKAIIKLETCIMLRKSNIKRCIPRECVDRGHLQAIKKLKRVLKYARREFIKIKIQPIISSYKNNYKLFVTNVASKLQGVVKLKRLRDSNMMIVLTIPKWEPMVYIESVDAKNVYKGMTNIILREFS